MMRDIEALNEIFREELDDESLEITPELGQSDLMSWDSLAHVRIIAAVEERFDFQFSLSQIEETETVGDLLAIIAAHRG